MTWTWWMRAQAKQLNYHTLQKLDFLCWQYVDNIESITLHTRAYMYTFTFKDAFYSFLWCDTLSPLTYDSIFAKRVLTYFRGKTQKNTIRGSRYSHRRGRSASNNIISSFSPPKPYESSLISEIRNLEWAVFTQVKNLLIIQALF